MYYLCIINAWALHVRYVDLLLRQTFSGARNIRFSLFLHLPVSVRSSYVMFTLPVCLSLSAAEGKPGKVARHSGLRITSFFSFFRRRPSVRHYSSNPICRPTPSASKPIPRTPCRASYASLEQSFAAGHFSSGAGGPSPSPTYCSPCSPSPSRVLLLTPSSSRMVVRYHTSSRSFSHSLARPLASARTQTAHPHRSPLYRPRLARVMTGQLLVLPGGGASPCVGHKFPGMEMVSSLP